jgi:hypothetical protein
LSLFWENFSIILRRFCWLILGRFLSIFQLTSAPYPWIFHASVSMLVQEIIFLFHSSNPGKARGINGRAFIYLIEVSWLEKGSFIFWALAFLSFFSILSFHSISYCTCFLILKQHMFTVLIEIYQLLHAQILQ